MLYPSDFKFAVATASAQIESCGMDGGHGQNDKKTTDFSVVIAPQVGLEPTTLRLTAECSAIELLRIIRCRSACAPAHTFGVYQKGSRACFPLSRASL